MEALLIGEGEPQGGLDPVHDGVVEVQPPQRRREVLGEHLLADIGLAALAPGAGAVVVDVLLLLDLRRERAAAVPAGDKPREGEGVEPLLAPLVLVAPVEDGLDMLPELPADQRLVDARVDLAVPVDLSVVEGVSEDTLEGGLLKRGARPPHLQSGASGQPGDILQRVVPGGGPLKELDQERRPLGVHLHDLLAVLAADVAVAQRRLGGPDALSGLLAHPLGGLLCEVVDVVLGHQDPDAVHKLVGGAAAVREDRALLDQMDLKLQRVEIDPVLQVAVEPVGLLHQDHLAALAVALEPLDHPGVVGPPGALGGLHVDVLLQDLKAVLLGVALEEPLLGGDREALALLIF